MKKNVAIGILSLLLLISFAACAYLYIDKKVAAYYTGVREDTRVRVMDTYDILLCDIICGKSIEEANVLLSPNEVVRFKKRQDLAHLYIRTGRVAICLDGDIILEVESSSYFHEQPDCLRNINLFDGTSQGVKSEG